MHVPPVKHRMVRGKKSSALLTKPYWINYIVMAIGEVADHFVIPYREALDKYSKKVQTPQGWSLEKHKDWL